MYDTMLKMFVGREIGWDQIIYIAQFLVYSLAHEKPINVGRLIMKELTGRLGNSPKKRGDEIFFPRFIQFFLNYKNAQLIELEEIDTQRIRYSKTMSKVLFGSLDAKNLVDVPLGITPHMRVIFEQYPLAQPIYFWLKQHKFSLPKMSLTHPYSLLLNP